MQCFTGNVQYLDTVQYSTYSNSGFYHMWIREGSCNFWEPDDVALEMIKDTVAF